MSTERVCLYCGNPARKVRKGDHLIPDAIGGTLATKDVCGGCNQFLSDADRELCSRSPLSLVAATAIDGHISQAWDVDPSERNLLTEGRPDPKQGFRIFPQMIVMPRTEQFRGDWKEIQQFGIDKFEVLFKCRLRKAIYNHKKGKKAFLFSEVPYNADLLTRYTHYPRFFVRGTVAQACANKTIELGYISRAAMRMALARIDDGLDVNRNNKTDVRMGSALPAIRCFFDAGKVWRALAKIAINVLHYYCRRTVVNLHTFPQIVEEVRGVRKFHPKRINESGFVWHGDVASIASVESNHSVRFCWRDGLWTAAFAFFGGKIGAAIQFSGPNQESWRMLDVTAPLHSASWRFSESSLVVPFRYHVEWNDLNKIIKGNEYVEMRTEQFEE